MLAVIGGTFDPFHCGHLYLVKQALLSFDCAVRVIPNGEPPHRTPPVADWQQRLTMCRLACAGMDNVSIGDEEAPGQVRYMAATLAQLRRQQPQQTLLLILGADSYNTFEKWHRPQEILQLAHLVVAARPPHTLPAVLPWGKRLYDSADLTQGSGGVFLWQCTPPAISASACRKAPAQNNLPAAVADYIKANRLYQASLCQ